MNAKLASLATLETMATTQGSIIAHGFTDDVRATLFAWQQQGQSIALVTLVNFEGSSPRPVGSQLLVSSNGQFVGLISGGCLESALIEEAIDCIHKNTTRLVRYGRNSDYMDIRLPCGSGIDVLIMPNPDSGWVERLFTAYQHRDPIEWNVDLQQHTVELKTLAENETLAVNATSQNRQLSRDELERTLPKFRKTFVPRTRLIVVGEGAIFDAFVAMASVFDLELVSASMNDVQALQTSLKELDRWSVFLTVSHDHDDEAEMLNKVLSSEAFYVAALGSRATHAQRREALKLMGRTEKELARIKGPAGLDIGGRTPPEIAVSILAEIVAVKNGKLKLY